MSSTPSPSLQTPPSLPTHSILTPREFISTYFREEYNPEHFTEAGGINDECDCASFEGDDSHTCPFYWYMDLMTLLRSVREHFRVKLGLEPYTFLPDKNEQYKVFSIPFEFDFMDLVPADNAESEFAVYVTKDKKRLQK
jgi:hypothetical protein